MKRIITILLSILSLTLFSQHLPLLGHYAYNGVFFNPAITGSEEILVASATYRKQWLGIDQSPNNQILSAHTPLKRDQIALGGFFYRDQIGAITKNSLFFNYAYRVPLGINERKLSFGMALGLVSERANWDELYLIDQVDEAYQNESASSMNPNLSVGLYYQNKRSYISFSMPFILESVYRNAVTPDVEFDITKLNYYVSLGHSFPLGNELKLMPSFLYRIKGNTSQQLDLTVLVRKERVIDAGIAFRTNGTLVFLAGAQIIPQLKMMYSYDLSLTKNELLGNSSHEISISYQFKYVVDSVNPKFF